MPTARFPGRMFMVFLFLGMLLTLWALFQAAGIAPGWPRIEHSRAEVIKRGNDRAKRHA